MDNRTVVPHAPDMSIDDLSLIRRITAGEPQAFEQLYQRYAPRLMRYLLRLLRHRDLAEEVLDDVLLIVWRRAAHFDQCSRLSTWIFGIAHHRVLQAWARTTRQRPASLETLVDEPDQTYPEASLLN